MKIATALISKSMFFPAGKIIAQEHYEEKEEAFVPHSFSKALKKTARP